MKAILFSLMTTGGGACKILILRLLTKKEGIHMYMLELDIFTDGDFGYAHTEFDKAETEQFYFEEREKAVEALVKYLENMRDTFVSSKGCDYIKDWLIEFCDCVEDVTNKYNSFAVCKDFGNQEISFKILEVEKKYSPFGFYYYEEQDPYYDWLY